MAGRVLPAAAALLAARLGAAVDRPNYVDLDMLRRARVIAVAGAAAGATGADAEQASATARVLATRLEESRRVQTVSSERVARVMEKLAVRTPLDLFKRDARLGLRLDLARAAALAGRCDADALLVPVWDTPPADPVSPGAAPLRLHVMLVHQVRRQIIWEDAQVLPREAGASPAPAITAAAVETAAAPLLTRFIAAWRLAGDRG